MNDLRDDRRSFWVITAATLGTWALHNALLLRWENTAWPEPIRSPAQLLLRAVVWLLPVAFQLGRTRQVPVLAALGVTTRIDRRGLLVAAIPAVVYLALAVLLARASGTDASAPRSASFVLGLTAIYTLIGVTLEELLMRGFVLRQQLRWTTPARAQAVTAVLYAAMHVPGWLALGMSGVGLVASVTVILLQGGVLGFVAYRARSIVPAIAVHLVNNLIASR